MLGLYLIPRCFHALGVFMDAFMWKLVPAGWGRHQQQRAGGEQLVAALIRSCIASVATVRRAEMLYVLFAVQDGTYG